jgi:hypothetical protein
MPLRCIEEWRYSSIMFYFGSRWRRMVSFTAQLFSIRKIPGT